MGRISQLSRAQLVARPLAEVFAFFSNASNLEALTPPFQNRSVRSARSRTSFWSGVRSTESSTSGEM